MEDYRNCSVGAHGSCLHHHRPANYCVDALRSALEAERARLQTVERALNDQIHINEDHRILNGQLRHELSNLKSMVSL